MELRPIDNKKSIILYILEILKEYSDSEHPILQSEIKKILEEDFDIICDRKTIANNIECLNDMGYFISHKERIKGEKSGYYYDNRAFDDSELRLLIDSILYSKHISTKVGNKMIENIKQLGSIYFRKSVANIINKDKTYRPQSPELFTNISILNEAIEDKKQVSFNVINYGIDKKLHIVGEKLTVSPYKLVYKQGLYFLIYNIDNNEFINQIRADRISNVVKTEIDAKPIKKTILKDENLTKCLEASPEFINGKFSRNLIKIDKDLLALVIDEFGDDVSISTSSKKYQLKANEILVYVNCSLVDIYSFIFRHNTKMEVLEPQQIRTTIKNKCKSFVNFYSSTNEDKYSNELSKFRGVILFEDNKLLNDNNKQNKILDLSYIDISKENSYKTIDAEKINAIILQNNNITDFNFIERYKDIHYLKITNNSIEHLQFFNKLKQLQKLDLRYTNISKIDFIKNYKDLRAMCLCKNEKVQDYSAIYECKSLEVLSISNFETRLLDVNKLKRINPNISIYIGEEERFDNITDINYPINLDYKLNKNNSVVELIKTVFDIKLDLFFNHKNKEKITQIKSIWKNYATDITNLLQNLPNMEKSIAIETFINFKSPREIIKQLNISIEQFIAYRHSMINLMRDSEIVKNFIFSMSHIIANNIKSFLKIVCE